VTTAGNESDNFRRSRDDSRGLYEVWYLTWNHAATNTGYWLRYTLEYPSQSNSYAEPHAEIWFASFDRNHPSRTFGIHRRFPAASSLSASSAPFLLRIAANTLTHSSAVGGIAGDGHDVSWNLRWNPNSSTHRHLPDVMYKRGGIGETTVQSPNVRAIVNGELVVDGRRIELRDAVIGQTHLWGRKHASSWAWGRCAQFAEQPTAWLEALAVRLVRRGVTLPALTLVTLMIDDQPLYFNQFRHTTVNRSSWRTGHFDMTAINSTAKLRCEMSADPSRFIMAPYRDPDGTDVFCANTEIADATLTVWRRKGFGWGPPRQLTSQGGAHFETGGNAADPLVQHSHSLLEI
jgi:hypothetical protein